MKKFWLSLIVLVSICQYCLATLTVSSPAGSDIWQFDNVAINWTSDNIADGSQVSIILCQNGIDYDTLSSGHANVIGPNSFSWSVGQSAGGNYSIKVISDSDPNSFALSPTFAIVAPTITASAPGIAQFDNLAVSWSVAGAISNDVTITVVENSKSAVVSDGSTTYNFTTDNSADWSPGTYTIVVTSSDQPTISDSISVSVSSTAISGVNSVSISQYENLAVSWTESGSLGASILVTASNGGFSQSTTVSAGTGSATFTTDTSWPAGSYSISVSSVAHPAVSSSTSITVGATSLSLGAVSSINQYENLAVSWSESGSLGASILVTATNGGFSQSTTVSAGTGSATFTTDTSWPAGSYSISVSSVAHPAVSASTSITVGATSLSLGAVSSINQYENLAVSWTESGAVGASILVTASNGGFSQSTTVSAGTGSATFTTDTSWPAGSYSISVSSVAHPAVSSSTSITVGATSLSLGAVSSINQYENLAVSWTESGAVGASILVTASNGGFSQSTTVSAGTGSATFTTDTSWPAGSYSISVSSVAHPAVSSSTSITVGATSLSLGAVSSISQYENLAVSWSESGSLGASILVTATNGGFSQSTTVSAGTGSATFTTDTSWPAGSYSISVSSVAHPAVSASTSITVGATSLSLGAVSSISQYENLAVSWSESGSLGASILVTATNGGFSQSTTVSAGTGSATFTTDTSWPAGSYSISVSSVAHPAVSSSTSITVGATSLSLGAVSSINQYENLAVSWTESGAVGASILVTATNGGFSQSTTVSAGTASASFTTDTSWPAGSYSISVSSVAHPAVSASTSITVGATSITLGAVSSISQYENLAVSWTESGAVGATVDIEVKAGSTVVAVTQVATGTGTASIASDGSWSAGTYTVTVSLTDHPASSSSQTFAVGQTDVTLNAVADTYQYDTIDLSWSYQGSSGNNVVVKITRNSDSVVVSSQTLATTTTDLEINTNSYTTWPVGTYTATVQLVDRPACVSSQNFTVGQTAILTASSSVDGSSVNQLDQLAALWTSTGNVGNVGVYIYQAGVLKYTITGNTANDGYYSWNTTLSHAAASGYNIRIASRDFPNDIYCDALATFTINPTAITVGAMASVNQFDNIAVNFSTVGSVGPTVSVYVMSVANGTLASATGVSAAAGTYSFTTDLNWPVASDYYVRVVSEQYPVCYKQSAGYFSVAATSVNITSAPDLYQLETQTINWTTTGSFGTNAVAEIYYGGSLKLQQTLAVGNCSFATNTSWLAGTYTIKIMSEAHPSCFTTDTFELGPTVIDMYEPVEACNWQAGATHRIAWKQSGASGGTVTINLYQGSTLVTTATATAATDDKEYFWSVPISLPEGNYSVKIISNQDSGLMSSSSANIAVNSMSLGGYIYSDSGNVYSSGLQGIIVYVTGPDGVQTVSTNNLGYWSTGKLSAGDYLVKPQMPRRYFEKEGSPDDGDYETVYSLNGSTYASSHDLRFLAGYKLVFVTPGGAGGQDGKSWSSAMSDLQAAINLASADPDDRYEEVWVKKGTYAGPLDLGENCTLVGSLAGVEDPAKFNLNKRDLLNNPSIISGAGGTGHIIDGTDLTGTTHLDGFTIRGNSSSVGAGMYIENATLALVSNCTFYQNKASNTGGGISSLNSNVVLTGCNFKGNTAGNGGGGAVYAGAGTTISMYNCSFAGNFAPWLGAAVVAKRATTLNMYSCTIVSSLSYGGSAIEVQNGSSMHMENSIFYYNENYKGQVLDSQYYKDSTSTVSMVSCHVQGTGAADPKFLINPTSGNGTWGDGDDNYGDLHLQVTSPCINAGYGSGSTVYDRDGDLRFANGALDIGSDECNFDLATVNSNERVTLNPVGSGTGALNEETYITLDNTAGGDNSSVEAIQIGENIHPDQSAYRVVGSTVIVETTLADGDYEMTLVVPFTYDDLGGLAWNSIVLSYFDVNSSSWVSAGTGTLWVEQAVMPAMEELRLRPLGDYGVYWDSSEQKGFAWANVNHTTDFAPLAYNRPGDFDGSGQIDVNDLILLMEHWQLSQSDENWQDRYDISEPADGIIDLRDFAIMASHWLE